LAPNVQCGEEMRSQTHIALEKHRRAQARSRWTAAIALISGVLLACYGAAALAASVDWQQSYNNAGHTGNNRHETILSAANVSGLQLNWARSFSGEVRAFVVNDHYAVARVPSDDGKDLDLWYINYATGDTAWRVDTGPDVPGANGTLATGDKLIFSECGLVDAVGYKYSGICAYRKKDGHKAWQFSNPCNCMPEANVVTPLVFSDNGIVLFGYFNGGTGGKEYVLAARAATGEILGAYQTGGLGSLGGAPITRGAGKIFFDCGGNVCALDHRNGSFQWKANLGAPIGALSTDREGRVYANLCNGPVGLIALNGSTGAPLWSYGAPECNQAPAATVGNRVYFTAADQNVHAVDALTGAEIWSAAEGTTSSPSLANGVMYVDGASGSAASSAYDATTGALLWSSPPRSANHYPPPVIIDGTLYVANGACGSLCAYHLPIGSAHPASPSRH
jgi:outer membrane protein assembly factor BamB